MRFGHGARPNGPLRFPTPPSKHFDETTLRLPGSTDAVEPGETALAAWLIASLIGVAIGLSVAKYSQYWAREALHPGAVLGFLVIVLSLALMVVAGRRYAMRGASRLLVMLATLLVVVLAWAAINIVVLAGWDFPPARPERPAAAVGRSLR